MPDEQNLDGRPETSSLLEAIRTELPRLEEMLARTGAHWTYEDLVYRYYHHSYKVFAIQSVTEEIVSALRALLPERPLNEQFGAIVAEGTGRRFKDEDNGHWDEVTRPMLEAFFHARFFLEMAVRYGRELERPPRVLPSGWAALLYLYGLR